MNLSLIAPDEQGWVNARFLHAALGVKSRFNDWIRRRITPKQVQGVHYKVILKREKIVFSKDYFVSTRFAEHLSMMEDTPASESVRDYYIDVLQGVEKMVHEIVHLRQENALLKAPKKKRLANGRAMETITNIIETRDIFGNVTIEKRIERKYRDEMTESEKRLAAIQHCSRVQEGLSKRLRKEACGDNVVPMRKH